MGSALTRRSGDHGMGYIMVGYIMVGYILVKP